MVIKIQIAKNYHHKKKMYTIKMLFLSIVLKKINQMKSKIYKIQNKLILILEIGIQKMLVKNFYTILIHKLINFFILI